MSIFQTTHYCFVQQYCSVARPLYHHHQLVVSYVSPLDSLYRSVSSFSWIVCTVQDILCFLFPFVNIVIVPPSHCIGNRTFGTFTRNYQLATGKRSVCHRHSPEPEPEPVPTISSPLPTITCFQSFRFSTTHSLTHHYPSSPQLLYSSINIKKLRISEQNSFPDTSILLVSFRRNGANSLLARSFSEYFHPR